MTTPTPNGSSGNEGNCPSCGCPFPWHSAECTKEDPRDAKIAALDSELAQLKMDLATAHDHERYVMGECERLEAELEAARKARDIARDCEDELRAVVSELLVPDATKTTGGANE